jgi:hypothetical protein
MDGIGFNRLPVLAFLFYQPGRSFRTAGNIYTLFHNNVPNFGFGA